MDSETKDMYHETARELGESGSSSDEAIYHSTNNDVRDMQRMGKPQQLRVRKSLLLKLKGVND